MIKLTVIGMSYCFLTFRIIAALSTEERALFRERIRSLDKKIHPGLTKLTWASKGISDYFVSDCRVNAAKVQLMVDDYKGANMEISTECVKISEMLLIKIDPRKVYENLEFDEEQVRQFISSIHIYGYRKTYFVSSIKHRVTLRSVCRLSVCVSVTPYYQ